MAKRHAKRIRRELTPQEKRRWEHARSEADRQRTQILAEGRQIKTARNRLQVAIRDALQVLKGERQAQGLSLSEIERRTGIGRAALCRLENDAESNPTVVTLTRYAEALGKRLVVSFE